MFMEDVKTYTNSEAQTEWNKAREARRRILLARVNMRDSELAAKHWNDCSQSEQKLLHQALNEDFFAPTWYINKDGDRINRTSIPLPEKSQELIDYEEGEDYWDCMAVTDRFKLLLANGIGADAEQGKFACWNRLSPELRGKLILMLRAPAVISNVETPIDTNLVDPRQMSLF